ncbi:MAG: hypothetical protein IPG32_04555 [Saprospirales bacterium]|nr:hypothetical protein [Saprospirales bacterium]
MQYLENGEVTRRHFEIDGKIEGIMTDYFPGGKIRGERMFKTGSNPDALSLLPRRQIRETQYFTENGLKDGGDTTFYESGSPQLVVTYREGIKHGYLRRWSPEGDTTYEARFEKDSLVEVNGKFWKKQRRQAIDFFRK